MKFTKQLNIQFKVLSHKDSHYTATLFKHLKHFCVQYRDHTLLFSCDDKHSIQVGEPHHAAAALDRGRRVLGLEGDHDLTLLPCDLAHLLRPFTGYS